MAIQYDPLTITLAVILIGLAAILCADCIRMEKRYRESAEAIRRATHQANHKG